MLGRTSLRDITISARREFLGPIFGPFGFASDVSRYQCVRCHGEHAANGVTQSCLRGQSNPEMSNEPHVITDIAQVAYWRYGLDVARDWKEKLGQEVPEAWTTVAENLAPPPQVDGLYTVYEGLNSSWWNDTSLNGDPRSLIMLQVRNTLMSHMLWNYNSGQTVLLLTTLLGPGNTTRHPSSRPRSSAQNGGQGVGGLGRRRHSRLGPSRARHQLGAHRKPRAGNLPSHGLRLLAI